MGHRLARRRSRPGGDRRARARRRPTPRSSRHDRPVITLRATGLRASASSTTSRSPWQRSWQRGERVLIVDWDVHHGNGTQDIFWDDPAVALRVDAPVAALPGYRAARPTPAVRTPPGPCSTSRFRRCHRRRRPRPRSTSVVAPAVERFAPTWVLVSAGFDAHRDDPLADLAWSAGDYARLARRVQGFAPGPGRLVALSRRRLRPRRARTLDGVDAGGPCRRRPRPRTAHVGRTRT